MSNLVKKEGLANTLDVSATETKVCQGCGRTLPLSSFPRHRISGYMKECRECRRRQRGAEKNSESNPLAQFTARDLMHELSKRGYKGELTYTEVKVHKMSLKDF